MTITRIGIGGGAGTGGQRLLFARVAGTDGWLSVSGQTPMVNGEVVGNGIVEQSRQATRNVLAIPAEAGYGPERTVRYGVQLGDPCDFQPFNKMFKEYFSANPPARACVVLSMVINCKAEVDCMTYKKPQSVFS